MNTVRINKRRTVASFHNLPVELQDAIKRFYPNGYTDSMIRIDKPNGEFFYAVPFETDDVSYLVKIDVKIDGQIEEEEDKEYYNDEIKGAEDIVDDGEDEEDDDPIDSDDEPMDE